MDLNVEIVSIGEELLLGDTTDTNASWLARRLGEVGAKVARVTVCGDVHEEMVEVISAAARRASVVVCTGGLGPTEDDRTRFAVAQVAGAQLELHDDLVEHIKRIFACFGRTMPEKNVVQAMIPKGATVLPNARGTAAGFAVDVAGTLVACLPGVPHEMKAMVRTRLLSMIGPNADAGKVRRSRHLHCFGLGESSVNGKIADLMTSGQDPAVGLTVDAGVITVRITARGAQSEVEASLARMEKRIVARLGNCIYGRDGQSLQEVVGEMLMSAGKTIALAESCTAGLIASRLGEIPGISASLLECVVTYSNDAKSRRLDVDPKLIDAHGAVSAEVASAMAQGVRKTSGADLGLSVTGIAGPTGGSDEKPVGLVYLGLADASTLRTEKLLLHGERNQIRDRASSWALNLLRLSLSNAVGSEPH